jgi:hypothetical protein
VDAEQEKLYRAVKQSPEFFFREILGATPYAEQVPILADVRDSRRVAIKSGHSAGKDWLAARLALWFHVSHYPSIVVVTGPCFDDKTEILTDAGWKLFRDLNKTEKVASLVDGEMRFVTPRDWMNFPSPGEMIGHKGRDLDFLVSPNHRLYVRREGCNGPRGSWGMREASECYGQTRLRFSREVKWSGVEDAWSERHYELFGFWMADGYARAGADRGGHKRYEVTLTQAFFPEYARDLLLTLGEKVTTTSRKKPTGCERWRDSWNYTVRGKKWASFFVENFYRGREKFIPDWVLNASTSKLRAFIKGYYAGDGDKSKSNGGVRRIRVYGSKELADRLQIAAMKAGYVVNVHGPNRRRRDTDSLEWSCTLMARDGHAFPNSHVNLWYRRRYTGRIYCVKVDSGVIMVRRNGVYHWSGNTDRQVRKVVWGEIADAYKNSRVPIGGTLLTHELQSGDPRHYMIGYTATRSDAFQGFHSDNVLVVVTEASGISPEIWKGIDALMTARAHAKLLAIGNALYEPGSEFAAMFAEKAAIYKTHTLDSRKSPYCSPEWIEEMRTIYGEGSPVWLARVEGIFPTDVADTLIPLGWIERAHSRWTNEEPLEAPALGVDVARFGSDETVFYEARGPRVRCVYVAQGHDLMDTAGRVAAWINEQKKTGGDAAARRVRIDDTGLGGGVTDRLRELGHYVTPINFGASASDSERYANARSELFFTLRERFRTNEIALDPADRKLLRDVSTIKYRMTSKGQIQLESKADMKKRLGHSPDRADALALACIPQSIASEVSSGRVSNSGLLDFMREQTLALQKNSRQDASRGKIPVAGLPGAAEILEKGRDGEADRRAAEWHSRFG